MKCRVTVDIPDGEGWVEALGLGRDGPVQQFHTANVLRRIVISTLLSDKVFIIILTHAGNNVRPRRLPKPRAVRGGFFLCQPPPCATILVYFAAALPAARGTLKEETPCLPLLCAA